MANYNEVSAFEAAGLAEVEGALGQQELVRMLGVAIKDKLLQIRYGFRGKQFA